MAPLRLRAAYPDEHMARAYSVFDWTPYKLPLEGEAVPEAGAEVVLLHRAAAAQAHRGVGGGQRNPCAEEARWPGRSQNPTDADGVHQPSQPKGTGQESGRIKQAEALGGAIRKDGNRRRDDGAPLPDLSRVLHQTWRFHAMPM